MIGVHCGEHGPGEQAETLDEYESSSSMVDGEKVGIEGLSRYGKAALVTMAYDQRFSIGFIGSSGEGGASRLETKFLNSRKPKMLAFMVKYYLIGWEFLEKDRRGHSYTERFTCRCT